MTRKHPLARVVSRRLLALPAELVVIATLSFILLNLIPSDPAGNKLGDLATAEQVAAENARLGLDEPLLTQYWNWVSGLFHFDLGRSYYTNERIAHNIWRYLPSTLELVALGVALAALLGVVVGMIGAALRARSAGAFSRTWVTLGQAMPDFMVGLLLIYILFYVAKWAPPPTGQFALLETPPGPTTHAALFDSLLARDAHAIRVAAGQAALPVLTLGLAYSALFAKVTRSTVGRAYRSNQVEFARACGLRPVTVLGYAFRAARTPILTAGGLLFAGLAGGTAIIESVFSWHGLGQYAVQSVLALDLPAILGNVLVFATMTLLVFLILDIVVVALDPRVRVG